MIDLAAFACDLDGTTVVTPCMSFVVFLDMTDDGAMLDFYQRSLDALGDRITHYQAESMRRFAKLDARGRSMVPTWFTRPRPGKLNYYMQMDQGDPDEGVTASRIELSVYRRPASEWTPAVEAKDLAKRKAALEQNRYIAPRVASMLRVTLPLDHPLAEPRRFEEWVLGFEVIRTGEVFSAYGGYAVNFYRQAAFPSLYGPTQQMLASICLRHPGFDWDGGGVQPRILRYTPAPPGFLPLVKRPCWLNILCDRTVSLLGGQNEIRARLPREESIDVIELRHGVVIRAGLAPQIGDVGHRDFVPAYRHVAHLLRPVRIADIDGIGANFMASATNEWLNAFDKKYD